MDLKSVIEWVKLKPRHLIGVGVTCIVVVGLPQSCRASLQYDEIIGKGAGWIALVGMASLVYGSILLVADYIPQIVRFWREWRRRRRFPETLLNLSSDEKRCLAKYIEHDVTSMKFPLGDGIANALVSKNVLYRASDVSVEYDEFAFNIQPWVVRVINERSDIKEDLMKHTPVQASTRRRL